MVTPILNQLPIGFQRFQQHTLHVARVPGFDPQGMHVALIHGIAGTASSWIPLMRYMIPFVRDFLVMDLPGHGFSPAMDSHFTCIDAYDCIRDCLLKNLDPEDQNLIIGNSLGGAFALKFAYENPDYAQKCVLISPAGAPFPKGAHDVIDFFCADTVEQGKKIIERVWVHPSFKDYLLIPAVLHMTKQRGFRSFMKSITDIDDDPHAPLRDMLFSESQLRAYDTPTLLIWGDCDHVLPREMRDFYDGAFGENVTRYFPKDYGHCPQFEVPKTLAASIQKWLNA